MNDLIRRLINDIQDTQQKEDCILLYKIMEEITQETPKIWGKQMLGFGTYSYQNSSGKHGEWFMTGFAPRSKKISIYLLAGFEGELKPYLKPLGKYKIGKGCLYINKLENIDINVLKEMIKVSYLVMSKRHGLK